MDDSKDITNAVKTLLESVGYGCAVANSAKECLELMRNKRFDLVLLDLAMPEVSGFEVLKILKEEGILADNKILLFSVSPKFIDAEVEMLKNEYGVLGRVRKPFTNKELLDVIAKNVSIFFILLFILRGL